MNDDFQKRFADLEQRYLELEACSVFQTQAVGTLLALIEHCAVEPIRSQIRPLYFQLVRQETEKFLSAAADDAPNLASRLREILQHQLDKPYTP